MLIQYYFLKTNVGEFPKSDILFEMLPKVLSHPSIIKIYTVAPLFWNEMSGNFFCGKGFKGRWRDDSQHNVSYEIGEIFLQMMSNTPQIL